MNTHDDWQDWSTQWQQQPVVDVERLRRRTLNKRRRMLAMVAFETVVSMIAVGECAWLLASRHVDTRWKLFALGAMVLVTVLWIVSLWLRKGTWRAAGERVADLLRLQAKRARAGLRLAQLQLWAVGVVVGGSIALAWPSLQPSAWMHDAALRRLLLVQIVANAPIALGGVAFCLWYIRRQRRRLARIAQMQAADD
ncbi:MAG: hypothetical protein KGN77_00530 [Xanthomonadaceae bacterium]|nr:hypothetical protein [Xanthomonadaceae bacterium]MDE1964486.1 hypothetical protein [Xanthomonadaceae bacterium]